MNFIIFIKSIQPVVILFIMALIIIALLRTSELGNFVYTDNWGGFYMQAKMLSHMKIHLVRTTFFYIWGKPMNGCVLSFL